MTTLTITSVHGGITTWLRGEGEDNSTAFIPEQVISGICAALVNGRSLEDALAPVYVIEEIIQAYHGQRDWQMPPLPESLGGPADTESSWTPEQLHNWTEEFQITPLVAALCTLDYFGGGYDTQVTLEGKK